MMAGHLTTGFAMEKPAVLAMEVLVPVVELPVVVVEHKHSREREEVEADKESERLPPPPWRRRNPARPPTIIIVRIVGHRWRRGHGTAGGYLVRLRLRVRFEGRAHDWRLRGCCLRECCLRGCSLGLIGLVGRVVRLSV